MKATLVNSFFATVLLAASHALASQGTISTWHGHAAFEVTTPTGKIL